VADLTARAAVFRNSRHIAFYFPNDGEIDLTPLIDLAWIMRKSCFMPVLDSLRWNRLWFAPYRDGDPLVANRYGIPEPAVATRRWVRARDLDLILMPLVAFDQHCNRIGMGGGYYDRTLSYLRHRRHWRRPRIVGVAYQFQKVSEIVPAAWDVTLDGIVTDERIYRRSVGRN
jgi:5-formyltetrahydrofolate cyclo-ligase